MKALILNGAVAQSRALEIVHEAASDYLRGKGWEVDSFMLGRMKIAPCMGCFDCWMKTPGVCAINDAGRDTAKAMIRSDLLLLLTPVTFGGYSSELKKALDRMIPLISPYFMKINGETHHKPRYERFPDYAGSERIFKTLVHRNAINTHSRAYAAEIITEDQDMKDIETRVHGFLSGMEGKQ